MTKFKNFFAGIFGLCVCAALPLAQAQNVQAPDGVAHKRIFEHRILEVYSQLGLTETQKNKLEANKKQHRAQMESVWQAIKTDKKALQEELMKPQLNMERINAIHDKIKSLQARTQDNKLASILAVRSILTPEQFLKFITLMHNHNNH